jgi:hypothetical protein
MIVGTSPEHSPFPGSFQGIFLTLQPQLSSVLPLTSSPQSSIIPHKLPTPIVEIFHRLISGVEYYPIVPYGLFTLFADPFNLGVPEIFKMVVVVCGKFMFPHFDALQFIVRMPFSFNV